MFSNVSCSLNMTSTLYCYLLFVKLLFVYIVEWPLFVVCSTSIVYIVGWPLFVVCSTSICLHCGVTSICCLFNYYLFTLWSDLYLLFVKLLFVYIVEWPLFVVCSTSICLHCGVTSICCLFNYFCLHCGVTCFTLFCPRKHTINL
jgi:hypothetical protein